MNSTQIFKKQKQNINIIKIEFDPIKELKGFSSLYNRGIISRLRGGTYFSSCL